MNQFLLTIQANSLFSGGNAPALEILIGGIVVSSASMQSGSGTYQFLLDFTGDFPSSLTFRFASDSGDPSDTITFTSVSINNRPIDLGTYLKTPSISQGDTTAVDTDAEAIEPLFGQIEPDDSDLGPVTIMGTSGDDPFIGGTPGDDVIDARDGNDFVVAFDGNDGVIGGEGNDQIFGMEGHDIVLGGNGDDLVIGGEGNDELYGQAGNDTLIGENGNDTLNGGAGDDFVIGDAGEDVLFGGAGIDTLSGGTDNDVLHGEDGNDILAGEDGDDSISGGEGSDTIFGGNGNDFIDGGEGNDTIQGDDVGAVTFMEAGRTAVTQANSTQWHTITFAEALDNPVVKMFAEDVTSDPFTIRVRNITNTGFEFQLDEFDYQDGSTGLENLSWLAVSSGRHTLPNGLEIEAGMTTATDENSTTISFGESLTSPVVFSQVSSNNEASAVVTRNSSVSSSGFTLQMQEEEANSNSHATEDIGWIAIEAGGSVASGLLVGITGDNVTHTDSTINFGGSFTSTPAFIADMQTLDGGDTAYTVGSTLSNSQAQVHIDEEQSANSEVSHTSENVGYIVLNEGTYTAIDNISGSDVIHGGDGDDIIYADAVEDNQISDGSSANPLSATISSDNPDAYWRLGELSGTTAENQGSLGSSVDGSIIGGAVLGAAALYAGGSASIDFDGMNDGILIPDSVGINTSTYPERTVELVFNADDVTTRQVLFEEGGTTNGLTIYLDGNRVYVTGEDDGNWVDADISASVVAGQTYHIAFVFDQPNNSFTGYLDGVNIGSVTVDNTIFPGHSGDIGIGYAPDGVQFHDGESSSGGFHFDGRISDVAIYNSALSASDIQDRADAIAGTPITPIAIDDILFGGDGFDQLYGGDGRDVFIFEALSAFNDVDEINAFDVGEQDALDISDLLTGYIDGVSDINDFVTATTVGSDTIIAVDTNGAVGGASFTDIAQLNDTTNIDIDTLLFNNSILPL